MKTASWVRVLPVPVQPLISQLLQDLDQGEAEAIVLALDIKADYVLMDETLGRQIAVTYHLQPLGLLGVLVLAKHKGLIGAVAPLMDRLQLEANFFIDRHLYLHIKSLAKE